MEKTYTCQSCGKFGLDSKDFKILDLMGIGWVICKGCLKEWSSDEES